MNISGSEMIDAMEAAGCSQEQVVVALKFIEQKRGDRRRELTAKRVQTWRVRNASKALPRNASNALNSRDALHAVKSKASETVSNAADALPRARADEVVSSSSSTVEPSGVLPVPVDAREARSKRATPLRGQLLPDDWSPSEKDLAFGRSLGLTEAAIKHEDCGFQNYFRSVSGAKALKRDWHAAFKNWLSNSIKFASRGGPSNGQGRGNGQRGSLVEAGLELINEERANGGLQPASREDFVNAAVRMLSRR